MEDDNKPTYRRRELTFWHIVIAVVLGLLAFKFVMTMINHSAECLQGSTASYCQEDGSDDTGLN